MPHAVRSGLIFVAVGAVLFVCLSGAGYALWVLHKRDSKRGLFGSMKGTVLSYERPFDPIEGKYDIDREGVVRSARPRR